MKEVLLRKGKESRKWKEKGGEGKSKKSQKKVYTVNGRESKYEIKLKRRKRIIDNK